VKQHSHRKTKKKGFSKAWGSYVCAGRSEITIIWTNL